MAAAAPISLKEALLVRAWAAPLARAGAVKLSPSRLQEGLQLLAVVALFSEEARTVRLGARSRAASHYMTAAVCRA